MGKLIDKRLVELGGTRSLELFCADEATCLEETVEEWKKKIREEDYKYEKRAGRI